MTPGSHDVVIVGAAAAGQCAAGELLEAGINGFVMLDKDTEFGGTALDGRVRPGREVISSVFDDETDTWALRTVAGEMFHGRVVIAAHPPPQVPWIPELAGRNEFRGTSFHAGRWDVDFDPNDKRIAVIGADATAGHYIGQLTESAASVTVFAHPPRRIVHELPLPTTRVKRWLRRHTRPPARSRTSRCRRR